MRGLHRVSNLLGRTTQPIEVAEEDDDGSSMVHKQEKDYRAAEGGNVGSAQGSRSNHSMSDSRSLRIMAF